ncbi:MAG: hypothetical protein IPL06_13010 [Betaproteobacteria bacterium]|nr:hypothetical protein [Betaproteobacteria bacterium]
MSHSAAAVAQARLDRRRRVRPDDSMIGFTFAALACLATIIALVLWM